MFKFNRSIDVRFDMITHLTRWSLLSDASFRVAAPPLAGLGRPSHAIRKRP